MTAQDWYWLVTDYRLQDIPILGRPLLRLFFRTHRGQSFKAFRPEHIYPKGPVYADSWDFLAADKLASLECHDLASFDQTRA